ncbi:cytochrome P450 77A2-like [Telopea speciosissima]|uniref:cytochrome P450 77A2-like n=1 Tax=Telopea speciosissima TaxID=54955 RepID=UPI001CC3E208|nr:cytochrome P450 77A2-like [Telopea speciosissima]
MDSFLPFTLSSDQYRILLTAIVFVASAFLFLVPKLSKSKRLNLPPGPPGWPVVGNLFQVAGSGKPFFQYVRELIPVYGPILTLKMGTRTMVIISSPELAHEALIQKGQVFANRPRENPTRKVFSVNKFTVNSAVYGPVWRSLRRNMVQNMLSNSRLKEFREVRVSAVDLMIDRMKSEAEANQDVVSVLKHARFAVFCILVSMCFGVEMDGDEIERIDQMMKTVLIILDPRIDDYLPILAPFFSKQRKQAMQVREEQIKTLLPYIDARRSALKNHLGSDKMAVSFSYLDTLYDLKIEGRQSTPTNDELVTLCSEFLNGGTDTTATALEWAIARLIEKPEIQSRIYEEIKSTVGDRKVDEKDVESMVYLSAVTKELLRKHPPTYFSLTHAVTEPATLGGYDVPTDANVEIFLSGIAEDDRVWSDPKEFNPDRFLSGKEDADITGVKGVKMIPFGAGRRICPGLSMASLHIDLMLARMVQEFQWKALPSQKMSDFSEKLEFTVVMDPALQAVITARK